MVPGVERVFGALGYWPQCHCYNSSSHVRTEGMGVEDGEKNQERESLDSGVRSCQVIVELSLQHQGRTPPYCIQLGSDRWFEQEACAGSDWLRQVCATCAGRAGQEIHCSRVAGDS